MQFDTQQRASRDDMIAWRILCKIFERSNGMRGSLNLIQEYQRFALCAGYIRCSPNSCKNSMDIEVLFKEILQNLHLFKVHIRQLLVILAGKLLHQPSLSHLSGTLNNKRFTILFILPFLKFIDS